MEHFTVDEPEQKEKETETEKKEIKQLEGFEGKILNGLNDGTITNKEMEKLIDNGTFTKKNLENIIDYIDTFKNNIQI
jgi:hypothetical protein